MPVIQQGSFVPTGIFRICLLLACIAGFSIGRSNTIQVENIRGGTAAWQITKAAQNGEIQAYTGQDSVNAGERLDIYVSTSAPLYNLEVFRLGYYKGLGGRILMQSLNRPGLNQGYYLKGMRYPSDVDPVSGLGGHSIVNYFIGSQATNVTDARWQKSYSLIVPSTWPTGVYVVKVTELRTGTQWHAPFVVRDDYSNSEIVCKIPFHTDQAYNYWGGASAYGSNRPRPTNIRDRATHLCYNRPYILGSGSQNLFLWEYPLVRFLEEIGYDVSYTTNNAIASGKTELDLHYGLAVAGHDEYVSQNERAALERAMSHGLSVAFFGANNMYWQVREVPDFSRVENRMMVTFKDSVNNSGWVPHYDPVKELGPLGCPLTTDLWSGPRVNRPERNVTGADYAGLVLEDALFDFVAGDVSSWVTEGTGLRPGDHISGLIGDEVDTLNLGLAQTAHPDYVFHAVGASPFTDAYSHSRIASSILIEHPLTNNFVFDAGAMFWNARLGDFQSYLWMRPASDGGGLAPMNVSPAVRQMTRNVLFHLAHGLNGKNI